MNYHFKFKAEFLWGILITGCATILLEIYSQDLSLITDWRTWAVSLALASVRPMAGYALGALRGPDTAVFDARIQEVASQRTNAINASERLIAMTKLDGLQELREKLYGSRLII